MQMSDPKAGEVLRIPVEKLMVFFENNERIAKRTEEAGTPYAYGEAYGMREAAEELRKYLDLPEHWHEGSE